jgi:chromate transporter
MSAPQSGDAALAPPPSLSRIAREWTRIGLIGFGGPPAHLVLLRELVVERQRWIDRRQFEDAIAASGLLPGPASTQVAIYCARVLGGPVGAVVGALGFILPGLVAVVLLAGVFLAASPPLWVLGAGAGGGAAVPAVAVHAGAQLLPDSLRRAGHGAARWRWALYALAGALGAAFAGPAVVLVLLASGIVELAIEWPPRDSPASRPGEPEAAGDRGRPTGGGGAGSAAGAFGAPVLAALVAGALKASLSARIAWMGLKVGALSYGGGFVIVPLMQSDAVDRYGWMTDPQFLSAVAIGQVTPGPVTNTVAAVGWSANGAAGALLAAFVAFAPSVLLIASAGHHFERIRGNARAQAFLRGSGPAALGAILGSSIPLASGFGERWQWIVLAVAAPLLLSRRLGVVPVLLLAALAGALIGAAGGPVPR